MMAARRLLDGLDFDAFERVVMLSPHLDDAALSCGGLLHALQGISTLVVTLCSGNPPPLVMADGRSKAPPRRGHVSPAIRRREDIAAMHAIGTEFVHLSFPDAIYRRNTPGGKLIYRNARERWIAPHADDHPYIEELHQLLRRICLDLGPVLLISPMGIGDHVDHQITARVAMRLAEAGASLLFYEDFPYVANPLSGRGDGDGPQAALARLGLASAERFSVAVEVDAKMKLLRHYASQVPVLFDDDDGMRRAIEGHRHDGQPCEFYWRAQALGLPRARRRYRAGLPGLPHDAGRTSTQQAITTSAKTE
jgi:LmbE family N-acetylglucosaminyl deacetylase